MINLLKTYLFQLLILGLSKFRPNILFEKINHLKWYKKTLRQWVEEQNFPHSSKIFEAGCATGALSSTMVQIGYKVTGGDLSHQMIEHAKSVHNGVNFLQTDVLNLPFESNEFDVVIATSLLNIVSDKEKCLSELTRCCKKGGVVSVLIPSAEFNDEDLHSLIKTHQASGFSAAVMKVWHNHAPKMKTNHVFFLFTQAGLMNLKTKKYLQGMVVSVSAVKPL